MNFFKYHALGNDYIVIDPKSFAPELTEQSIKLICHRNFGIGSNGILCGPLPSERALFRLRIFHPDGSEAEKSGNGLRIFSRYLFDSKARPGRQRIPRLHAWRPVSPFKNTLFKCRCM